MAGPLEGIRVVDLTTIISGPMCTQILGDQGADIVKVERIGVGDTARRMGAKRNGLGASGAIMNRHKRSIEVDLQTPEGRDIVLGLARSADVMVENYRPGVADRLGIGYDRVREINPAIIYVSISGFGQSGPYVRRRVYDSVVQGMAGFAVAQADPETGKPQMINAFVVDKVTALTTAQAVTAALYDRDVKGRGGQHIEMAMLDAGIAFNWLDGMWNKSFLGDGVEESPNLNETYQVIAAKNGYLTLLAGSQAQWPGLCRALGREELIDDPRFSTLEARMARRGEVREMIRTEIAKWDVDEICRRLYDEELAAAKVYDRDDMFEDPQVRHNGIIVEYEHPHAGRLRQARPAARFRGEVSAVTRPAPMLGEHTREILREAGYEDAEITRLEEAGIVRAFTPAETEGAA